MEGAAEKIFMSLRHNRTTRNTRTNERASQVQPIMIPPVLFSLQEICTKQSPVKGGVERGQSFGCGATGRGNGGIEEQDEG